MQRVLDFSTSTSIRSRYYFGDARHGADTLDHSNRFSSVYSGSWAEMFISKGDFQRKLFAMDLDGWLWAGDCPFFLRDGFLS